MTTTVSPIAWAAFHAQKHPISSTPTSITGLLPLFMEKADTPAMVKHGLDILIKITKYLNPEQLSIMACDCPIFAQCKLIQWRWPDLYGEDKLIIMFGGLHMDKALWNTVGDLLCKSGWTDVLVETNVATSGTADSYLNATHITRTRHAHQVTCLASFPASI